MNYGEGLKNALGLVKHEAKPLHTENLVW